MAWRIMVVNQRPRRANKQLRMLSFLVVGVVSAEFCDISLVILTLFRSTMILL